MMGMTRKVRSYSTWPGDPSCTATFAVPNAVTPGEDRDSAEAAGFGDRGAHAPDRAIRICAAPRPWLQGFEFAVCAALAAAWGTAQPLTVPPAETTVVRAPPTYHFCRRARREFISILSINKEGVRVVGEGRMNTDFLLVGWPTKTWWEQTEQ